MYAALWHRLPGPVGVRALTCLVLALAVVLLLFTQVFPKLEHHVPFTHDTVTSTPASPAVPN